MQGQWVRNYLGNFNFGSWGMDKGCAPVDRAMPFLQMATTQPILNQFCWNFNWLFFVQGSFKNKKKYLHQGGLGWFMDPKSFTRVIPESLKKSCLYKFFYKICLKKHQKWLYFCKKTFLIRVHLGFQEAAKVSKFEKFGSIPLCPLWMHCAPNFANFAILNARMFKSSPGHPTGFWLKKVTWKCTYVPKEALCTLMSTLDALWIQFC